MADYKFYLKDKNNSKETQVRLHVHYNNKIAKIYIGEKIHPDHWNASRMRAKQTSKFSEHPEFNQRLDDAEQAAKTALHKLREENEGEYPEPDKLARYTRIELKLEVDDRKVELLEYFDRKINEENSRLAVNGIVPNRGSYPKSLKRTKELLEEYAAYSRKKIRYESITLDFYYKFLDYMRDVQKYSVNTMGKHIKYIKTMMKAAEADGFHSNREYKSPKFKILEEESDAIYLDEEELKLMEEMDLSDRPGLERARDWFLVGCWTGLRYSDLNRLNYDMVKGDKIDIRLQKTGVAVVIPLLPYVKRMLDKYKNDGLPTFTNQAINRPLKELGKKLEEKSKQKSLDQTNSKYSRITTHTARRSFATNMYFRTKDPVLIMKITGHKTQSEFFKYIRITPDEGAEIIQGLFQDSKKLNMAIKN